MGNKKKSEQSVHEHTVETTKHFTPLTLRNPLVIMIAFNLFLNMFLIVFYLIPQGELIFWMMPLWFIIASCGSIHTYLNCRDYSFLDDIHSKKSSYKKNSGIQLIVCAYFIELSSVMLSLLVFLAYLDSIGIKVPI